jgi:dTDP-4-dehydrorhamnose 3,5-epimerase
MKVTNLEIEGLKLIGLDVFGDARGFFVERFNREKWKSAGLPVDFIQDNHSRSAPGILRGLHFQYAPAQLKIVGVARGRIFDVAVDLRPRSKTFMKHFGLELTSESGQLLLIPHGFAHGFCVIGDEPADVVYKVDTLYNPKGETGLMWNDPDLNIRWPIGNPILSDRDKNLQSAREFQADLTNFALR